MSSGSEFQTVAVWCRGQLYTLGRGSWPPDSLIVAPDSKSAKIFKRFKMPMGSLQRSHGPN